VADSPDLSTSPCAPPVALWSNHARVEYGDFQTPPQAAADLCDELVRWGIRPRSILEPTCGRGNLLRAALNAFPNAAALGIELNSAHLETCASVLTREFPGRFELRCQDAFQLDWDAVIARLEPPVLVLGNPPWVTNAALGVLKSGNLPPKTNLRGDPGLIALTGGGNFDVSEWLLIRWLEALARAETPGWLAMLVKTSVARRVLSFAWRRRLPLVQTRLRPIDASLWFGATVEAGLFVCALGAENLRTRDWTDEHPRECPIVETLDSEMPPRRILGWRDHRLVADLEAYERARPWLRPEGSKGEASWRSGIKHDCAAVMELIPLASLDGRGVSDGEVKGAWERSLPTRAWFRNGLGETVELETEPLYPLLKGTEVARGQVEMPRRWVIVTQTRVGEPTERLRDAAPLVWSYLERHGARLDRRASSVYRKRSRFAVFGIGPYAFAPGKVAISGLSKHARFVAVGSWMGKPVMFDDTVAFFACEQLAHARCLAEALNAEAGRLALEGLICRDAKRPITIEILNRLNLERLMAEAARARSK